VEDRGTVTAVACAIKEMIERNAKRETLSWEGIVFSK
jgi:hypothetical protein